MRSELNILALEHFCLIPYYLPSAEYRRLPLRLPPLLPQLSTSLSLLLLSWTTPGFNDSRLPPADSNTNREMSVTACEKKFLSMNPNSGLPDPWVALSRIDTVTKGLRVNLECDADEVSGSPGYHRLSRMTNCTSVLDVTPISFSFRRNPVCSEPLPSKSCGFPARYV